MLQEMYQLPEFTDERAILCLGKNKLSDNHQAVH